MRAVAGAAIVVAAIAAASDARATEGESHIGIDVGGGLLIVSGRSPNPPGGSFMAHYTLGLSDAFDLMVEAQYSPIAIGQTFDYKHDPSTYPTAIVNGDVGIGYVFDVLSWVPYAGLLAGAYNLSGGTLPKSKVLAGAELALGLDYRVDPHLSVGLAGRQHLLSETSTYPSFTQLLVRVEYVWGW